VSGARSGHPRRRPRPRRRHTLIVNLGSICDIHPIADVAMLARGRPLLERTVVPQFRVREEWRSL
jgi:hypothetical protein